MTSRARLTALFALALASLGTGCRGVRTERVQLPGTLHVVTPQFYDDGRSEPFGRVVDHTKPRPSPLTFSEHGRPLVFERPVNLPLAQEDLRYGAVLVEVSPLPAAWRPLSAPEGGVVVSALDRGSPLALAGLRCGDRILAVGGREPSSPADVVAGFEGDRVQLEVLQVATLERVTIEAEAVDGIYEHSHWSIPGVFTVATSNTGTGFKLGPWGALVTTRSAWVTDDARYVERTEWAALFDMVAYESETDPLTGETRSRWRLFWQGDFGDD